MAFYSAIDELQSDARRSTVHSAPLTTASAAVCTADRDCTTGICAGGFCGPPACNVFSGGLPASVAPLNSVVPEEDLASFVLWVGITVPVGGLNSSSGLLGSDKGGHVLPYFTSIEKDSGDLAFFVEREGGPYEQTAPLAVALAQR